MFCSWIANHSGCSQINLPRFAAPIAIASDGGIESIMRPVNSGETWSTASRNISRYRGRGSPETTMAAIFERSGTNP